MIDMRKAPYSLQEEDATWVENTLAGMTLEEKIGQLFCPMGGSQEPEALKALTDRHVGGIMFRPGTGKETQAAHRFLQEHSKYPMLIAADLEQGGVGSASDGTLFGWQMLAAATGEPEQAYRLGYVSGTEGAIVGVNWDFGPVVDIDRNWRNPITNVRTYGSDPACVLKMGQEFMRGLHEAGMAAAIKHFPGDGCDERDQHLHPTVNNLSAEKWMESYGHIYRTLVEEGADTVMVGHIAQPAWVKKLNPEASFEEQYRPATLSPELIEGLLRKEIGFNGMIVSDATTMVGFTQDLPRREVVPYCISIGVDMFLFNRNFEEDYQYMMEGYQKGILTEERLNEAVTAILALKAHLKLHKKKAEGTLVPGEEALAGLRSSQFQEWAKEVADKGITLIKDTRQYLTITPERYKKIALFVLNDAGLFGGANEQLEEDLRAEFTRRGFEVYEAPDGEFFGRDDRMSAKSFEGRYDLALYVLNLSTSSSNTVVRIGWKGFLGRGNNPWFVSEIRTRLV